MEVVNTQLNKNKPNEKESSAFTLLKPQKETNNMKTKMMELGFTLLTEEVVPVWEKTEDGTKVVVGRALHEALKLKTPYNAWTCQTALNKKVEEVDYWTFKNGQKKEHILPLEMALDLATKSRTEESTLVGLWLEEVKKGNLGPWTPEMISDLLKKAEKSQEPEQVQNSSNHKLTVLNQGPIPVYVTEKGTRVILGRELHEALGIKTRYTDWFSRITNHEEFRKGENFYSITTNKEDDLKGRPRQDHILTLDMAQHIAWLQKDIEAQKIGDWLKTLMSEKDLYKEPYMKELKENNNSLTIFSFENQNVRTLLIDGEPWFVGKDVATILGYKDTVNALKAHIREEEKRGWRITTPLGGIQTVSLINESGLYRLIFRSKLPSAERFTDWVTSEVLPSIRKTGQYQAIQKPDSYMIEDSLERAERWMEEERRRRFLETQLKEAQPKIEFADAVEEAQGLVSMGYLAKAINQRIIPMGRNRLFKWMRENGYLIRQEGNDYDSPTQRSSDAKWFEVIPYRIDKNGTTELKHTVKVTPKGYRYFINKFLEIKKQEEERKTDQQLLESLPF